MSQIPIPSKEQITNVQINTILGLVNVLSAALRHADEYEESKTGALDGGVKSSLEASLMQACACLDSITADAPRWSLDSYNKLELALAQIYENQVAYLKEQRIALFKVNAPHRFMQPKLYRLTNGAYAAIYGDPNNLDAAISGVGPSAEAAMLDFDRAFQEVAKVAESETTVTVEPINENVDGNGKSNPETDAGGRKSASRNRRGPRKK